MTTAPPNLTAAYRRLDRLYRRIPEMECRGLCGATCSSIPYSALEGRRIEEEMGCPPPHAEGFDQVDPSLTLLEAAKTRVRPTCSMLEPDTKRCRCYAIRPAICRLWGVVDVDGMRCPYGCRPKKMLTNAQSRRILRKVVQLSIEVIRESPGETPNE